MCTMWRDSWNNWNETNNNITKPGNRLMFEFKRTGFQVIGFDCSVLIISVKVIFYQRRINAKGNGFVNWLVLTLFERMLEIIFDNYYFVKLGLKRYTHPEIDDQLLWILTTTNCGMRNTLNSLEWVTYGWIWTRRTLSTRNSRYLEVLPWLNNVNENGDHKLSIFISQMINCIMCSEFK